MSSGIYMYPHVTQISLVFYQYLCPYNIIQAFLCTDLNIILI